MKTTRNILIIALVLAVLFVTKYLFFPAPDLAPAGGPKGKGGGPAPVEIYVVKPSPLDNRIFISGTIMANEEVNLVPEAPGKVTGIFFNEGAYVQKGQLLVKLNDASLRAALKKLEVQEKLLASQEQRMAKLMEVKGISQEEYELTLSQLNAVRADIELNRTQLDEMEIKAPFSGKTGIKNISVGSYVSPTTVITVLQQSDPVKIDFYVPEKYVHLVKEGDTLSFTVEGNPNRIVAKIAAIDPAIDQATRTLRVRAVAPNKNQAVLPGAFARVNFLLDHTESALMVPTESLIPVLKGKKVFVIKNGVAQEAMVETGLRTERSIQVINGLQEGDTVVTKGTMQVKPGSPVKISGTKKEARKK